MVCFQWLYPAAAALVRRCFPPKAKIVPVHTHPPWGTKIILEICIGNPIFSHVLLNSSDIKDTKLVSKVQAFSKWPCEFAIIHPSTQIFDLRKSATNPLQPRKLQGKRCVPEVSEKNGTICCYFHLPSSSIISHHHPSSSIISHHHAYHHQNNNNHHHDSCN